MDPWRFMALVARCASESQIEVERAFRFMAALQIAMQQGKAPEGPPPVMPPSASSH
jgi:hypothetical protein